MLICPAVLLILYCSRSSSIIYKNAACMYYENFSQVPSWESSKAVDLLLLIFTIMWWLHCCYIIINVLLMFSIFTLLLHIITDLLFITRSLLDIIMSLLCLYYNIFRNWKSFTSHPITHYYQLWSHYYKGTHSYTSQTPNSRFWKTLLQDKITPKKTWEETEGDKVIVFSGQAQGH